MECIRAHNDDVCGEQLVMLDKGQRVTHTCVKESGHAPDHEALYPLTPESTIGVWVYWTRKR